ncbi:MAG: FMN-binding glutamate synthase family protein [Aliidongia sp.]
MAEPLDLADRTGKRAVPHRDRRRGLQEPYSASIFNISAMSFGALSANAIKALNKGAKLGNFAHDTGEGSYSKYHREMGGDIIWELGSGYFGCRNPDGTFSPERFAEQAAGNDQIKMIEIKLSQGAKPGHGGVLPGAKVSGEIAAARGVPEGVDCISPSRHSAFSTPIELTHFIARLRELSGGKPSASSCASVILGIPRHLQGDAGDRHLSGFHRRRRRRGRQPVRRRWNSPTMSACRCGTGCCLRITRWSG